jgi:hypothetical protein
MASFNVYRGIGVRALMAGAALDHDQISVDMQVDDIPAVGFEDTATDGFTYDDGAMGVVGHTLSGSGYWDAALNPHNAVPGLRPCLYIQNCAFYLNKPSPTAGGGPNGVYPNLNSPRFYGYPVLRCLQGRTTAQLRGRVDFSYTAKSCGLILYPSP